MGLIRQHHLISRDFETTEEETDEDGAYFVTMELEDLTVKFQGQNVESIEMEAESGTLILEKVRTVGQIDQLLLFLYSIE